MSGRNRQPESASYVLGVYGVDDFLDEQEARELVRRLRARDLVLDVHEEKQ